MAMPPEVEARFPVHRAPDEPVTEPEERRERRPLSDQEILGIVQREIDSALGWTGTRLAEARRQTLNEYFANPRGDEVKGRSQVTTRVVFEEVEWALPLLLEPFVAAPEVAAFVPKGTERPDLQQAREQEADQRSAAANHVFSAQHDADLFLETFAKDGLIQKNGWTKVTYQHAEEATHESYEGLTLEQVAQIDADPAFEIRGIRPYGEDVETSQFFDVEGVRIENDGRVVVENVPPEEMIVNRDARSINEKDPTLRAIGHRDRLSASELIDMGYDEDLVERLPASQSVHTTDQDAIIRSSQDDSNPLVFSNRSDSERTIFVTELYIRLDKDGDGVSEWHRVMAAGEYAQILLPDPETGDSTVPVEGHPFATWTPIGIPHRLYGYSLADVTRDLQEVDTSLWRLGLDNAYLSVQQRWEVLSSGSDESDAIPMVNLNQLLKSEPGGYVEKYAENALKPIEQPLILPHIIGWLEMHREMRQHRTGISPEAMGLDPDAISKHVFGAISQQSASQLRARWYARRFATGVKRVFQLIDRCLLMHHTQPMTFRLRGEWFTVDPSAWRTKMDCEITVGLGAGSRMEKALHLQTMLDMQKQAIEAGARFVQEEDVYETFKEFVASIGFRNTQKYLTDPSTLPPQEPEEDPARIAVEYQQMNETRKLEIEAEKVRLEHAEGMKRLQIEEMKAAVAVAEARADGASGEMLDAVGSLVTRDLALRDQVQSLVSSLGEVAQRVNALHEGQSAPRRFIRDENGMVTGVEMNGQQMPVQRDESGQIVGIGG